jgi:hypothetical protein
MGFNDIKLTNNELQEFWASYDTRMGTGFPLSADAKKFIVDHVGMHVAFIKITAMFVRERCMHLHDNNITTIHKLVLGKALENILGATRGITEDSITDAQSNLLVEVLNSSTHSIEFEAGNQAMVDLIMRGVLMRGVSLPPDLADMLMIDPNLVGFCSPVLADIFLSRCFYYNLQPTIFTSVTQFAQQAVARMSFMELSHSFQRSASNESVVLERHWQNEFYRAAKSCLDPKNRRISPDVGRHFGITGQVDFYINGTLGYLVELTIGDRMPQHEQRFELGGAYYPLIATREAKQCLILDFRYWNQAPDRFERTGNPLVWHVLYNFDAPSPSRDVFVVHLNDAIVKISLH